MQKRQNGTGITVGHNEQGNLAPAERVSDSQRGYDFQDRITEKLVKRLDGFSTVKTS
jgi:hypothetical protein